MKFIILDGTPAQVVLITLTETGIVWSCPDYWAAGFMPSMLPRIQKLQESTMWVHFSWLFWYTPYDEKKLIFSNICISISPWKKIRTMTFCVIYDVSKEKEMREFVSILVSQVILNDIFKSFFISWAANQKPPKSRMFT